MQVSTSPIGFESGENEGASASQTGLSSLRDDACKQSSPKASIPCAVQIDWLSSEHSCELCGSDYATGAVVFINGKKALEVRPLPHCTKSQNWSEETVLRATLECLGCQITETWEKWDV